MSEHRLSDAEISEIAERAKTWHTTMNDVNDLLADRRVLLEESESRRRGAQDRMDLFAERNDLRARLSSVDAEWTQLKSEIDGLRASLASANVTIDEQAHRVNEGDGLLREVLQLHNDGWINIGMSPYPSIATRIAARAAAKAAPQ